MRTRLFAFLLLSPIFFQACKCNFIAGSFTTAKFGELATYSDRDFSQKATQFGPMGPVYARVTVKSNPADVKVEFRFIIKEAGTSHHKMVSDYTRRVDLEGNNYASYWVEPSVPLSPGDYRVEADLIFKEKVIDKKSIDFKVIGDGMAPMPPLTPGQDAADFIE